MKISNAAKKIISLFLITCFLFSGVDMTASAAGKKTFSGRLTSDCVSDLSGIKLNVYESVLSGSNSEYEKYTNKLRFSVTADKKGRFSFARPSGMFIVTVDLSTLPKKTGITENMWVFTDKSASSLSAKVKKIDKINIKSVNAESGEIDVYMLSADDKRIYCDYTVKISEAQVTETVIADDGKRKFNMERKVTINANGAKKTHILKSSATETATPIVSLQKPEYGHPASYTEKNGFFEIHYDYTEYSAQTVKNIYDTFTDAKAYFSKFGLKQPRKETGSKKYNVYLVTSGVASATTRNLEKGGGYIILKAPKNYARSTHLFITASIAHELFHAIMNVYTRDKGVLPEKWFREAFANWAGTAYLGYSTESLKKYVNIFQSNPELPLTETFDSRVYGATVFPLTLSEYFGGMKAVKAILEEFGKIDPSVSNPEFIAMDKGLSKINKNYSFKKVFLRSALNNMYPSYFFSLPGSNQWNRAKLSAPVISESTTLRDLGFLPLSVKYYDVSAKTGGKSLYITITDSSGKYSDISICGVLKKTGGSRYFYGNVKSFSTYRIKNFSKNGISLASLGFVNTSTKSAQNIDIRMMYT